MRTRTSIAVNGGWLHDVDPRIVVQQITEGTPRYTPRALSTVSGVGQQLASLRRESLDITVTFGIMGHYDLRGRAEVLDKIAEWAASGSIITVDYRPGKRLNAVCVQYPSLGEAGAWNSSMSIIFRAFEQPYWESTTKTQNARQTSEGDITINVDGNMDTVMEATIVCGAQRVNSIAIECGNTSMELDRLSMTNGEIITIGHENGMLYIKKGGRSIMDKRTPESDDEIILRPGINTVHVESDASCQYLISARGRYL